MQKKKNAFNFHSFLPGSVSNRFGHLKAGENSKNKIIMPMKAAVKVVITGGAGNIGGFASFFVAQGMFLLFCNVVFTLLLRGFHAVCWL